MVDSEKAVLVLDDEVKRGLAIHEFDSRET